MQSKEIVLEAIKKSFVIKKDKDIFSNNGSYSKQSWMFDFRMTLCNSVYMNAYTDQFIERFKDIYPFQVTGLETASLPIIGAICQKMHILGMPTNGFYIRKSRKKYGLLNLIEGEVNEHPIIIIDDIINSGSTILKQQAALGDIGRYAEHAFSLLAIKDVEYYAKFEETNKIKIQNIYSLNEIKTEIGIKETIVTESQIKINLYTMKWVLKNTKPNYFYVVPKSCPVLYKNNIYYGRDDGKFLCVNSKGEILWSYTVPFGSKGKLIFSTALVQDDKVIFGAYDGNLYCLGTETGKVLWVNFDCDWIGSSPDLSLKNKSVYVGAEYGFWKKKGGLISVDIETGKLKWAYREMPEYTHGSPLVVDKYDLVVFGSNNGELSALNTKTGNLAWVLQCSGAIKHRPAYSEGVLVVADHAGKVIGVNMRGEKLWEYTMYFGSYCIPKIHEGKLYVTSFDKHIYCLNLTTGQLIWKAQTSARIFSSIEIVDDKVVVGTNAGVLYEYSKDKGAKLSEQIFPERITNKVVYDKETNNLYVLDYINNLYCLDYTIKPKP